MFHSIEEIVETAEAGTHRMHLRDVPASRVLTVDAIRLEDGRFTLIVNVADGAFDIFAGGPVDVWRDKVAEDVKWGIDQAAAHPDRGKDLCGQTNQR